MEDVALDEVVQATVLRYLVRPDAAGTCVRQCVHGRGHSDQFD
jgi:hypothetical protein